VPSGPGFLLHDRSVNRVSCPSQDRHTPSRISGDDNNQFAALHAGKVSPGFSRMGGSHSRKTCPWLSGPWKVSRGKNESHLRQLLPEKLPARSGGTARLIRYCFDRFEIPGGTSDFDPTGRSKVSFLFHRTSVNRLVRRGTRARKRMTISATPGRKLLDGYAHRVVGWIARARMGTLLTCARSSTSMFRQTTCP